MSSYTVPLSGLYAAELREAEAQQQPAAGEAQGDALGELDELGELQRRTLDLVALIDECHKILG